MVEGVKYRNKANYLYIEPKTKEYISISWLYVEYIQIIDGVEYIKLYDGDLSISYLTREAIDKGRLIDGIKHKTKIINGRIHIIMIEGVKYTKRGNYVYNDPKTDRDTTMRWSDNTKYIQIIDGIKYEKKSYYNNNNHIFTTYLSSEAIDKAKNEGLYYESPPKCGCGSDYSDRGFGIGCGCNNGRRPWK